MKTVYLRALDSDDKATVIREAIDRPDKAAGKTRFEVDLDDISNLPGSPFAYWISGRIRKLFFQLPQFEDETEGRTTRCGLGTLNDFRFLRLAWEIQPSLRLWPIYYHGGIFSPFHDEFPLTVNWQDGGREIRAFVGQKVGSPSRKVQGEDKYFHAGFVFPRRTKGFSPKFVPTGGIFSTGGQAGFVLQEDLLWTVALLSSQVCTFLVSLSQGRTGDAAQFEVGLIKRIPWPGKQLSILDKQRLSALALSGFHLRSFLTSARETSRAFVLPAFLRVKDSTLADRAADWQERLEEARGGLTRIQVEIDERCIDLYGIGDEDRRGIEKRHGGIAPAENVGERANEKDDESEEESEAVADAALLVVELISWAVGVSFGRFDVRLATGERQVPSEPEPFDPLPRCSPGMLTGEGDLPAPTPPADYPLPVPDHGILVGDVGRAASLTHRVREVFRVVFGDAADDRWDEAATILDPRTRNLSVWLTREFFALHIKQYSKSRRKAPIYWQLATSSASYAVWLYYPRLTRDTLFRVLQEEVAATLQHEERVLADRRETAGQNPSASQRRDLDAAERLVEELRSFRDEMARTAPLWNPDLDDGVIINFAPLWRLVPQHKAWQRELRTTWDALCAGDYDWAHLAMHLWPERVVPKCAGDRSLAIAHGLEEVFWEQDVKGKWAPRDEPTQPIEELIRERTSPAVKAALASLLEAPQAPGPVRGRRRRR